MNAKPPVEDKAAVVVSARVTQAEYAAIDQQAVAQQLTVSSYVRLVLLAAVNETYVKEDAE